MMILKKILFYMLLIFLLASCNRKLPDLDLELALQEARKNRTEIEQVIKYYSKNESDSLKLKAAQYLIANMRGQYSEVIEPKDIYSEFINKCIKTAKSNIKDPEKEINRLWQTYHNSFIWKKYPDLEHLTANYLINNIEQAFELWSNPWSQNIPFDIFCETLLPYRILNEPIEDWRTIVLKEYKDIHDSLMNIPDIDVFEACKIVHNCMNRKWNVYTTINQFPKQAYSIQAKMRIGMCNETALLTIYIMRAFGIPVTMEYTPIWGTRNGGAHVWNVVRMPGKKVAFMLNDADPDGNYLKDSRFGKVYQYIWKTYNEYPFKDVTYDYAEVADVIIPLKNKRVKTAKLCCSNRDKWVSACHGEVIDGKAHFKHMEKNIVYMPIYDDTVFGDPFLLTTNGTIAYFEPDTLNTIDMMLKRKYPLNMYEWTIKRMKGGRFEGANHPEFKNANILYTIEDHPELCYQNVSIEPTRGYRYIRYVSPDESHGNIAELRFYYKNIQLTGTLIGTPGYFPGKYDPLPPPSIEAVFDNDELTYFDAPEPNGAWVGLDFGQKVAIDSIIYLPRNDDNNIIKGQDYELFYWNGQKGWHSLGRQIASNYILHYPNAPSNALFLLRNHTKGKEERIFNYKDNKQIWR